MDIEYYKKLQNAHGTRNKREKELIKVNRNSSKHFDDTFDTEDVLVNNKPMQLMIVHDTDLNVHKKKIKSRHEDIFNLGDYVIWNDQVWLITLVDPDNKTWNRGYMYLCTILLRWQNSEGRIVERWCYSEDYTKYSMGETGNSYVTIGDYQYGLTLPVDDETKKINRNSRFVIDYEGNYPPDTYRATGKKSFLTDNNYFSRGGLVIYTLSYDFFNENKDKLITLGNGTQAWICDYIESTINSETNIKATISGSSSLRCGKERTWNASINFDNIEDDQISWNVLCKYNVESIENDKSITLKINDENAIGATIKLQLIVDNKIVAEKEISIIVGF